MSKLWLMALYEYKRHVWQKKFILALLSVPLVMALFIGVVAISVASERSADAIGYVDLAGVLENPVPAPEPGGMPDAPAPPKPVALVPYPSAEAARAALEAEEIQAYYVLAADFRESKRAELVYIKSPAGHATRQFRDFVQINVLDDLPAEVAERAVADSNLIVRWPSGREFSERTFVGVFVPILMAFAYVFLVLSSAGYLMGAVVEEKENRTMEVVVTSISPGQLIAGKVVGILGVTLTQLLGWVAFGWLGVYVGGRFLNLTALQGVQVDLGMLAATAAISVPPFVMVAALMTALGATVAEAQEAQQVSGLFMVPFMIPIWLLQPLMENPDGTLSLVLSLFPFTSVASFSLRLTFTQVPVWQILASFAISSLCALAALWLAGRAFRLGMLRYGQRLNWREVFARKRPQSVGVEG